ncbi:MAG: ribonuclease HII [bacterium]|nr:ribonuclease HII [bacterium]
MKSLAIIKQELEQAEASVRKQMLVELESDSRVGVKNLILRYKKIEEKYLAELKRIEVMKQFEYEHANATYICGIDEVGRGPLAGPVVAGAVILDPNQDILYLNDSKQLSEAKRNELYLEIKEKAIACNIGIMPPSVIDDINILNATYQAMREAVEGLSVTPEVLLNDAVIIPGLPMEQVKIIKGDARSISIAAASILAKVERDEMMVEYDKIYPEYGFAQNKGYGSKQHIEALKKYGPCPIHRRSFIKNFV